MKGIKQILKMVKYELIRIFRNKFVFAMLLLFCTVLLLALALVQFNTKSFPLAIYSDGINLEEAKVMEVIEKTLDADRITYVDSEEEGIKLVKKNRVSFFICLDRGKGNDEVTATFYYDQSNFVAKDVADNLIDAKNEYSYKAISDFLMQYGITLNKSYFELISFKQISDDVVTIRQRSFAIEVACCIGLVMMLGLAYSISRDNETQVSKNIAYLPVGIHKYMLSKIIPYFLLGIIQMTIMFILGNIFFDINFATNFFVVLLLSSLFVLSILLLASVFSMLKSQIAAVFIDMLLVLLPVFVSTIVYVQACPAYIQFILNCFPITPFISFLNSMIFSGVIIWEYIVIFFIQSIIYYIVAINILKKRIRD